MNDSALDFTAQLSGFTDSKEYKKKNLFLYENRHKLKINSIKSEQDSVIANNFLGLLNSLECYLFNTDISSPATQEITEQRNNIARLLLRYNNKFLIKDSFVKTVARYLLWKYEFTNLDRQKIISYLNNKGFVRKTISGDKIYLYIVGLHYMVGNNLFTCDSKGRDHRTYVTTCAKQAFPLTHNIDDTSNELIKSIPALEDSYHLHYMGSGKGMARSIAFKSKEYSLINDYF